MARDSDRRSKSGDVQQAPSEGCQSGPKASPNPSSSEQDALPDWKLVHSVRSGALNALRHAGVSEDLFTTVAAATYAPIRAALTTSPKGQDHE
jgi:hypothetical protein